MMSSETACFNGYAEEFLEVQMADAMPFKLFTDCTLQGMEETHSVRPYCYHRAPGLDIRLSREPLMKA